MKTPLGGREPALMDDGMTPYVPRINCLNCGRFVGRDGCISIEHFEMSSTIASIEGECRRCIDRHRELVPLVEKALRAAQEWGDGWLNALHIRNVIENQGGERYAPDEIQRATWDMFDTVERDVRDYVGERWPIYRWKGAENAA